MSTFNFIIIKPRTHSRSRSHANPPINTRIRIYGRYRNVLCVQIYMWSWENQLSNYEIVLCIWRIKANERMRACAWALTIEWRDSNREFSGMAEWMNEWQRRRRKNKKSDTGINFQQKSHNFHSDCRQPVPIRYARTHTHTNTWTHTHTHNDVVCQTNNRYDVNYWILFHEEWQYDQLQKLCHNHLK